MKNYVAINRDSYNLVASEYSHKMVHQAEYQQEVLNPLMKHLHKSIEPPIKVLDIGCGVGINSKILVRNGFNVEGIDVAKKMISYARYNVPQAKFREACFLESKFSRIYHGVIMSAFIHLFPKEDVGIVLNKVKSILIPGGYGLVSTTYSEHSVEGYYRKNDYNNKVKRFRKFWRRDELIETIQNHGLLIVGDYYNYSSFDNKTWINILFKCSNGDR